jgi:hypothetical protein
VEIGKRRPISPEEAQDARLRRGEAGHLIVLDEVLGNQVAEAVDDSVAAE